MDRMLEFDFEGGGRLRLELLEDGELQVCLQARHPGEGWKTTSTSVVVDGEKVQMIKAWLNQVGGIQ
jgi:hypothetical protein